jgi:hypothetical protein
MGAPAPEECGVLKRAAMTSLFRVLGLLLVGLTCLPACSGASSTGGPAAPDDAGDDAADAPASPSPEAGEPPEAAAPLAIDAPTCAKFLGSTPGSYESYVSYVTDCSFNVLGAPPVSLAPQWQPGAGAKCTVEVQQVVPRTVSLHATYAKNDACSGKLSVTDPETSRVATRAITLDTSEP